MSRWLVVTIAYTCSATEHPDAPSARAAAAAETARDGKTRLVARVIDQVSALPRQVEWDSGVQDEGRVD